MKRAMRNKRREIIEDKIKPSAKEKFFKGLEDIETMQQQIIPRFEAANSNQKLALAMLREGRNVVFLTGSSGTGKSMIAAYHASCLLKQKVIDKIYLIRPAVAVGKSIGLIPGSISEKLAPYFSQTVAHLEKFMGKGFLSYCLETEKIEMKPSEYLRGMSFQRCFVLAEESQNFTAEEFEMVLTRMGEDSCIVFTADEKQHDLRGVSGLTTTLSMIETILENTPEYMLDSDLDEFDRNIGIIRFTPEDVVRSGLTRAFVKMYYNN